MSDPAVTHEEIADAFAAQWPRLVATVVRDVGDLGMAEDCVQEAFAAATRQWPHGGMPAQPGGWLLSVARRKAIDQIRRSSRFRELLPRLEAYGHDDLDGPEVTAELLDDQLRLLLGCCHPALGPPAQVALTLRIVGGLSTGQIAHAFLVSEPTMTRRLTRAKTKIREANIPFTRSDQETLDERLPSVCAVIYSIFTEGHASSSSATLIRGDLCDEALWLADLLGTLAPEEPEAAGLLALLLFIDARRSTRVDATGRPILLADQDRSAWDRTMIARGLAYLARANSGRRAGPYQTQAAIAALHATAADFASTDWSSIVGLYEVSDRQSPSPVVALNAAVAIGHARGPQRGLEALDLLADAPGASELREYVYFHSARAEFLATLGLHQESADAFRQALQVSANSAEGEHLHTRLETMRALAL